MTKDDLKTLIPLDTHWDQDVYLTLLPAGEITVDYSVAIGSGL